MSTNSNYIARSYDALMGKNRIINGSCDIAQRTSGTYTTGVSGYSGPDRFFANNSSTGGSFTQTQGTLTYAGITKNCITQTVTAGITSVSGTNFWAGIKQNIEGFNIYDLLGQNITISFIFSTNIAGTHSIALKDGTTANSYLATFVALANTPTKYTFTIPLPSYLGIPESSAAGLQLYIDAQNQGTYQTSTLNAWQSGSFHTASTQTLWSTTIGNFISVTDLQLEAGNIATLYERRGLPLELLLCQRYYQTFVGALVAYNTGGTGNGNETMITGTPMRTTAVTLVATNTSSVGGYTGALTAAAYGVSTWIIYFSSSATAGQYCQWLLTVNAEL